MNFEKKIIALNWVIVALLSTAFGVHLFQELDIFIFLRAGNWMTSHRAFISQDFISSTFFGQPWTLIKWSYSLLVYWVEEIVGLPYLSVLQVVVNINISILAYKCMQLWQTIYSRGQNNTTWLLYLCVCLLLGMEFRMLNRPEMFSHLFTLYCLFIHLKTMAGNHKYLWWQIPINLLWVNTHDGFPVGLVLSVLYTAAHLVVAYQQANKPLFYTSMGAFIGSLGVMIANPMGISIYLYPFNIYRQVGENKFTPELFNVFQKEYWMGMESWMLVLSGLIGLYFLCYVVFIKKKTAIVYSLTNLLVAIALLYLAATAHRNIVFALLFLLPLCFAFIPYTISIKKRYAITIVGMGMGFVLYALVVANIFYEKTNSNKHFGFGLHKKYLPVDLNHFIDTQSLSLENAFADYLSSAYLIWFQQNTFKSYIDMRDFDVYNPAFFKQYAQLKNSPEEFENQILNNQYNLIFLYTGDHLKIHQLLNQDPAWQLIYLDHLVAVYKKGNSMEKAYIPKLNQEKDIFINHIFNPWWKNKIKMEYHYQNAQFLSLTTAPKASIDQQIKLAFEDKEPSALIFTAKQYLKLGMNPPDKTLLNECITLLTQALENGGNMGICHKGMGIAYLHLGLQEKSQFHLQKAKSALPNDTEITALLKALAL